jgi:hypothetical protein
MNEMTRNRIVINAGLARCGTTATETFFRSMPGFATPQGVKELKFFLKHDSPDDYLRHFTSAPGDILFESSPPYMQNGLETFETVLARLAKFRAAGFDMHLLVHARNLVKRAFSHYWHDINSHYAIYGKLWKVNDTADPRRFKSLYRKSFEAELANPERDDKFLPDLGQMLHRACDVLGADKVRLVHTQTLDAGLTAFLRELTGQPDYDPVVTPRVTGAAAPLYLYGGAIGASIPLTDPTGAAFTADIPGGVSLLFARRHQELLHWKDYDLEQIRMAGESWTRSLQTSVLDARVQTYLDDQKARLQGLPDVCFVADQKDAMIQELVTMPAALQIRPLQPEAAVVHKLLGRVPG